MSRTFSDTEQIERLLRREKALALFGTFAFRETDLQVVLEQAALQGGPLRISQPLLVITDPVVSIVLSVWLFGEYFVMNAATLTAAAAGFCVMCGGVVVMSLTAPATLEPDMKVAGAPRIRSG